jgi:hypothetical protein
MTLSQRFTATACALAVAAALAPAAQAADKELLDILLMNGSITQVQYDQLLAKEQAAGEAEQAARAEEIKTAVKENSPEWIDRMTWTGDFRMRYDWQARDEAGSDDPIDRNRARIRARFGFKYDVNDNTELGVQMATGSEDPISTNQTLDDRFSSKSIVLDKAYAKHTFDDGRAKVYLGKFSNPFVSTPLLFDEDLRFEGAAGQYEFGNGIFVNAGAFPLDESSSESGDAMLYAAQGGYSMENDDLGATASLGYYDFNDAMSVSEDETAGNTAGAKFKVWNPQVNVELYSLPLFVALEAAYAHNTAADADGNGWWLGATVGDRKVKDLGDWQVDATYRRLEADVTYDEFPDSDFNDFNDAGTNNKGWTLGYTLGLGKGWQHAFKYYDAQSLDGPQVDEKRIQADLKYKF